MTLISKVKGHESKHTNIDLFRSVYYFRSAWVNDGSKTWMKNMFLFAWYLFPFITSMSVNKPYTSDLIYIYICLSFYFRHLFIYKSMTLDLTGSLSNLSYDDDEQHNLHQHPCKYFCTLRTLPKKLFWSNLILNWVESSNIILI